MLTFPDGTRIWITDSSGKPLDEYGEQVEVDEALKTHTRSVYISAEKNAEFEVHYHLSESTDPCTVETWLDGSRAKKHARVGNRHKPRNIKGWNPTATTLQRFTFGEVDLSEEQEARQHAEAGKDLARACIDVRFWDAVVSRERPREPLEESITIAGAVPPDSKIASLVGCQVKAGSSTQLNSPRHYSPYKLKPKHGAVTYSARFFYRPRQLLIAQSIMPNPNPAPLGEAERDVGGSSSHARANTNKRKRSSVAAGPEAGAAAGGSETAEQRKKRLTEEVLAIKREFGEEAVLDAVKSSNSGAEEARAQVKEENGEGENSSAAINVDARPKNQKIFLDLSLDSDTEA